MTHKFPQAWFTNEVRLNPNLSTFVLFGRWVEGKKIPKIYVGKYFLQAVDKEDYDSADEEALIKCFVRPTKA
jgi:hypothetical protein